MAEAVRLARCLEPATAGKQHTIDYSRVAGPAPLYVRAHQALGAPTPAMLVVKPLRAEAAGRRETAPPGLAVHFTWRARGRLQARAPVRTTKRLIF
jgi:hypothetical protein